ncbi:metal ABC transporter permease [Streptococcus gallolyticus]|uniref:metal ABC transporter permease n=1 Tax=Streptococcus hepaticus TaxID=3349163 RepID=UPI001C95D370|nr:metal ABC transporter permease [Streptococcus gallolyticus]MBY5040657.1 metal ABC transporter permease [Streptococcus gallolyticus]
MFEVLLILVLVSASCGLIGSLLVLQNQSMLADALSHSVLLGIVLGFFISNSLDSPLLVLGATVFGVLSVLSIDFLHSQKVHHDAATGLVFSFFFALAVILISLFARNVHLDVDMVLMGEVIFAPLHRMDLLVLSLPVAAVKSSVTLLINLAFFLLFYQPLKLYLFDKRQAKLAGLATTRLRLTTLLLVSLTTVLAFDAVGSMTVIVFLVAPAMIALPWSRHFGQFLVLGQAIGLATTSLGFLLGQSLDLTMSGTCATVSLLVFCASIFLKNRVKS